MKSVEADVHFELHIGRNTLAMCAAMDPESAISSRTQFLVIGPQRSGTTVAYVALRNHPQVCGLSDEVYTPALFGRGVLAFTRSNNLEPSQKARYLPRLFEAIAFAEAKPASLAGGMKTAVADRSEADLVVEMLCGPLRHVKVILTMRHDLIAQFGSLKRAEATRQWHSWRDAEAVDIRITLDVREFVEYVERCRELHALLRTMSYRREDVLELSYESDIFGDIRGMASKLYEFLDIDDLEPTWVRSKKVAPPPEDFILNLDELQREYENLQ